MTGNKSVIFPTNSCRQIQYSTACEATFQVPTDRSESLTPTANLDKLIDSLVLWNLEIILLRNSRGDEATSKSVMGNVFLLGGNYEPSADKVATFKVLHQRFWGREADEEVRVECTTKTGLWRPRFNIPRGWGVNGGYWELCLLESLDDSRERLSNLSGEAKA